MEQCDELALAKNQSRNCVGLLTFHLQSELARIIKDTKTLAKFRSVICVSLLWWSRVGDVYLPSPSVAQVEEQSKAQRNTFSGCHRRQFLPN